MKLSLKLWIRIYDTDPDPHKRMQIRNPITDIVALKRL
jgi:hypothetical protein